MEGEEIITNLVQVIRIKEAFFISKEVWNRNSEDQNIKPRNKLKIHEKQRSTIQRPPRSAPSDRSNPQERCENRIFASLLS